MRASTWVVFLRVACLVALGTSVALLSDYVSPEPSFCGFDSGCGAVRMSGYGYIPFFGLGELPVPVLGILAFSFLYAASLHRSPYVRSRIVTPLSYATGVVGMVLFGLQLRLGEFCSLCLVVDACAAFVGVCAFKLRGSGWEAAVSEEESRATLMVPVEHLSEGQRLKAVWRDDSQIYNAPNPLVRPVPTTPLRLRRRTWVLLCVLSVVAPWCFPWFVQTSEVPSAIRGLYDPRARTVVEFFDFQCPHCQELSPRLKAIVSRDPGAKLRYGYTPLPTHPEARNAARITICAAEQGKEWEVAARFFDDKNLELSHITEVARSLVPDEVALSACLRSKRPDERILDDTARLTKAGFIGLPTTYIGGTRILGAEQDMVYEDALRRMREGNDRGGISAWAYALGVLMVLFALVLTGGVTSDGRRARKK